MQSAKQVWLLVVWIILGCGPDTIFLRPYLDTPHQHLSNGLTFLDQSKLIDAGREFERALELDPKITEAYIGLGLAYGRRGEFSQGFQYLNHAREMAKNEIEWEKVQNAYDELQSLQNASKSGSHSEMGHGK